MRTAHWCTADQAAHRLGLTVTTVQRLVSSGVLSSARMGRHHALSVADVERYAVSRRRCGIR